MTTVTKNNPEIMNKEMSAFIESVNAPRFSKNLRRLLVDFLLSDGGKESFYLDDLLADTEKLFTLLDAMEEQRKN